MSNKTGFFGILIMLIIAMSCIPKCESKNVTIAGTSFFADLFDSWVPEFKLQEPTVDISFLEYDSDTSLQMLLNDSVVMAALDYPVSDEIFTQNPDLQIVPLVGTSVVPYFSMISVGLTLDRETLADIFLGKVTKWNDVNIQNTNPSVTFSDIPINVIYRIDDALATYTLSSTLSSISEEWRTKYGVTRRFPDELKKNSNFYGAVDENGVFTRARLLGNAITYITANTMLHTLNLVQYARILNKNQTRTDLRTQFTHPVLEKSINLFDDRFRADIADIDIPNGFPIMSYTYLAFKRSTTEVKKCDELKSAIDLILFGINFTAPIVAADIYGYAYLPFSVVELVREQLYNITCNGKVVVSTTNNNAAPFDYYTYSVEQNSFSGLTSVPYVPFYNYLGSTISASAATTLDLSTISSLYANHLPSSSASMITSFFTSSFFLCFFIFVTHFL